MGLNIGQWAIAGTVAVFEVPPGACSVTFYSTAATGQLYLGMSTTLTASNGYAVSTYPTTFMTFAGSKGAQVYGLNTAATTLPVNYIVSTNS